MIGERLKHAFTGNDAWILSYREECFDQIGLKPSIKIPLFNGSLECEFRKYQMFDGKMKVFRSEGGEVKTDEEKRQMAEKHRFKKNREFKQRLTEQEENEDSDIRSFTFHKHDVVLRKSKPYSDEKPSRGKSDRPSRGKSDKPSRDKFNKPSRGGKSFNRRGNDRFSRNDGPGKRSYGKNTNRFHDDDDED